MYYILQAGGFKNGGNNFDAKILRQSIDAADLFHGHVGGVDILARGLLNAAAMIEGGEMAGLVKDRYAGWQGADAQASTRTHVRAVRNMWRIWSAAISNAA